MKNVVIIPARYESSRFPGKPLVKLLGKPMIIWVAELSAQAVGVENTFVATDDERIEKVVKEYGFNTVLTSDKALTGTDRLSEVAEKVEADIYVNVQGDEPLLDPQDILKIIREKEKSPNEVINGYCQLGEDEDPANINIPKVIFTEGKKLIYMSRSMIPGFKSYKNKPLKYYKQVCIYAFSRDELLRYGAYKKKSTIENSEDIEILRFLEWGQTIRMVETNPGTLAIDRPEDVPVVVQALEEKQNKGNND